MKYHFALWVLGALALSACGDDEKPKKKKAQAASAVEQVVQQPEPVIVPQPQPQPEVVHQPEPVPEVVSTTELPTDAQSGYKAYIEPITSADLPEQTAVAPVETETPQTVIAEEIASSPQVMALPSPADEQGVVEFQPPIANK